MVVAMAERVDRQLADHHARVLMQLTTLEAVAVGVHAVMGVLPQVALDALELVEDRAGHVLLEVDQLVAADDRSSVVRNINHRIGNKALRIPPEAQYASDGWIMPALNLDRK